MLGCSGSRRFAPALFSLPEGRFRMGATRLSARRWTVLDQEAMSADKDERSLWDGYLQRLSAGPLSPERAEQVRRLWTALERRVGPALRPPAGARRLLRLPVLRACRLHHRPEFADRRGKLSRDILTNVGGLRRAPCPRVTLPREHFSAWARRSAICDERSLSLTAPLPTLIWGRLSSAPVLARVCGWTWWSGGARSHA